MIVCGLSDGVTTFAIAVGLLAVGPLAYLGWRRPVWLIVLILLSMAVPGELSLPGSLAGSATAADAVSVFAVMVIVARAVLTPSRSLSPVLAALLVACLVASACVTFVAPDAYTSLAGFARFTQMFVLVPLAAYLALEDESDQRIFVGALIAFAIGQSLLAVYQALTETGASIATTGEESDVRGIGTFDASEVMALPIITTAAIMAALALALWGSGRARTLGLVSLLPLAAGQLASLSRGAWVAAAVGALLIALLKDLKRTAVAVGCIAIVGAAAAPFVLASSNVVSDRVESLVETPTNPDPSVRNRYGLWEASVGMWADHPLTGLGIKSFPTYRESYLPIKAVASSDVQDPGEGFRQIALESPHNLYLLFLAEQGLLGITAYGLLLAAVLIVGLQAVRSWARGSPHGAYRPFAIAMVAWLVTFLVRSLYGDISSALAVFDAVMLGAAMRASFGLRQRTA
jgi:O-antigen ligase